MLKWVAKQCGALVAKTKEEETENAINQHCSKASLRSWSTARKKLQAGAIPKDSAKPSEEEEEEEESEARTVHLTFREAAGMVAKGQVWNSTAQPSKEPQGSFQGNPSEDRSSEVDKLVVDEQEVEATAFNTVSVVLAEFSPKS